VEIGRDCAWRFGLAAFLHQVIRSRPIRMTIQERPDDPTIQHAWERLVIRLGAKLGDDFIAFDKAPDL
jgi:hypothetical protein